MLYVVHLCLIQYTISSAYAYVHVQWSCIQYFICKVYAFIFMHTHAYICIQQPDTHIRAAYDEFMQLY